MKHPSQLLAALALLLTLPAFARDFEYTYEGQTLTYTVIDEDAKTCCVGTNPDISGEVIVPEIVSDGIDEFTVVSISMYAFKNNTALTSISMPNSISIIAMDSFYGCKGLTSVVIPNSVTKIGMGAFMNTGLQSVVLSESLEYIYEDAFRSSSLNSVKIPDSVKEIGQRAFYWCGSMSELIIGNSVTTIGREAFRYSYPNTIIIGKSVESCERTAFGGCNPKKYAYPSTILDPIKCSSAQQLSYSPDDVVIEDGIIYNSDKSEIKFVSTKVESYTAPETVTTIAESAFKACPNLESVKLDGAITELPANAFYKCSALASVQLPNTLQTIGEWAFNQCTALKSISFPNGLQSIATGAFNHTFLENIDLPASLISLGGGGLRGLFGA